MATKTPKDEDLEVIIPADDSPIVEANGEEVLKVGAAPAEAPKEAPKVLTPEEGLEKLRVDLAAEKEGREAERTARLAAEQRANEQARSAAEAQGNVQDTNLQLVVNAIGSVTQTIDVLEGQYAEALA
jgi:hypothetical protein